ncbi:MAG: phenylalanine--tRNA ligase subunit beta [Muribaculaceae bacterium]|nr:phenylalanine--tRNA ligase subunit beta [Muribaculaceae bacterium]
MNISYKWLKEYINLPADMTPEQVAAALTSIGLETGSVERVESIRGGLHGIVIGKVLTCYEHPDSDHLHITTVDLGGEQPEQIVCGAPNVAAGQTVVVATVGTTLYDGDKEFKIKKSKIRGVESFGMICAEDEIGVGHSHDGIIVLPDGAACPGTPAAEYFGLSDDFVLEVDLTPNRIDAASHYGVARDLHAWMGVNSTTPTELTRPAVDDFREGSADDPRAITVEVEATQACTRYAGVTIRGVKVGESPEWLRTRLETIGLRPINNVVDITNYILHAFCQPLHCFDADRIGGGRVVVRTCPEGTPFTTLDGVERKLNAADLMICDAERPMCMAGVFGGMDSGVTDATTDIFLESACFNPTSVRRTARRHGLSTDSSFRYERGVDPNGCIYALKLAALMVQQLGGGEICGKIVDIFPTPVEPARVDFTYSGFARAIGEDVPHATLDRILGLLEIKAEPAGEGALTLSVPTYRVDVTRPCDVYEELLRIYGYNKIPMPQSLHCSLGVKARSDADDDMRRVLSEQLSGAGYREIMNNSLTAESFYRDLEEHTLEGCVRLLNPLSQDLCVLRRTLLFGGLQSLARNINRRSPDLRMYEFGNVYHLRAGAEVTTEKPLAPYAEGQRLGLWLTGDARQASWQHAAEASTFYDLRATVDHILARLGITPAELQWQRTDTDLMSPALRLATRSGKELGVMGIVRPQVSAKADVHQPVYFAELDIDALFDMAERHTTRFKPLPKTQAVRRDLSLLLDSHVTMADIEREVSAAERKLLREVSLFDVYEGDKLPAGKKSYAIAIYLQDDERTLNDKQIDAIMAKILGRLTSNLGAQQR